MHGYVANTHASHLNTLAVCCAKCDCVRVAHADTSHQPLLALHSQLSLHNCFALCGLQCGGDLRGRQNWWAHVHTYLPILLQSGLD